MGTAVARSHRTGRLPNDTLALLCLDVLHIQARRERLLQLVRLVAVCNAQSVQVLLAANLELCYVPSLLDLHRSGILPASCKKEVLDFVNLSWL